MGRTVNVNVQTSFRGNVNVRMRKLNEDRLVADIMRKLGPDASKDEAYWHKVARTLSEDQIQQGLEIAAKKKPQGLARIRYLGGIYSNMMRSHGF